MLSKVKLQKQFVKQHGEYSCGLACLSSIVNYYGGSVSQGELMQASGTTLNGTSMLGLFQAAQKIGLEAKGFEAKIEHLKELNDPVILHVVIDGKREHFIVCYGFKDKFMIGDPGWGITQYSEQELEAIWTSKTLLQLKPGNNFQKVSGLVSDKWNWFKQIISDDIPILTVSIFLGVIIAILGLSTAIYTQKLIDEYLPDKTYDRIYIGLGLLTFLLITRSGLNYIRGILMVRQGKDLNQRVVTDFISKVLHLPQSFFNAHSTGDFIARMNDAQRIQRTVSLITGTIIIEILVIIISAAYVLYLSVIIGLISLSSIILYLFIAWKYHDKIVQKQKEVMATYAANESNYVDTLQGSAIIKSFGKEKTFIQRLSNIYQLLQEKIYDLGNLGNTYSFLTGTTASLFIVVIIFIGIRAVLSESLQLGEFIAILSVGGSLVPSIAGLVVSNIQIQEAQVAFDRMHEFVKHEVEYKPASDRISKSPTVNHITVQNLRFRFPGKKPLLDKVDLHIEKGKIVALFGEVGSGKSTLVDILQRFYVYEAGNILVDDKDWKSINLPDWREKISIVPQKEKIFNSTVLDNICLSNDQNEFEEVIKLCESYGFNKFIEKFQQGYLTLTGENGINLSGGQRQLISLARALYKHPEFLILDEATSAMDFTTEDFVFEMLKKQRNLGVLIITHRKDLVLKADEVYQLKDNRIYKMENQFMT